MSAPPPGGTGPGGYGAGVAPSSKGGSLRARPLPGPQMAERERIQVGEGSGAKAEQRTAREAAASCENVSDDRSARAKAETKREEFRARRLTAVSSLCDIGPDTPVSVLAALSGKLISGRYTQAVADKCLKDSEKKKIGQPKSLTDYHHFAVC